MQRSLMYVSLSVCMPSFICIWQPRLVKKCVYVHWQSRCSDTYVCCIGQVLSDGLILSFLGGFTGTVSINHLSGDHITTEQYKCLQKVLYVFTAVINLTVKAKYVIGERQDYFC